MLKYLLTLLIATFCLPVQALMLLPQSGLGEPASLSGQLTVLLDASGKLRIEDVAAPAQSFTALPGFLGAGFTTDTYWLRFTLQRTTKTPDQWLIEVAPPFLDDVTLFVPRNDGTFDATRLGDLHPYTARPVPHRNFVFPLRLPDDQPVTLYLRVKTTSTMFVLVFAWQYPGLLAATQTDTSIYAIYFGLIALGFMTNLVFWFWLRDRLYVSYCGYLAMLALVMMATGGFITQLLFPTVPVLADRLVGIVLSLTYLIWTHFFIIALRLREHFPRLNRIFDIVLGFYALCTLVAIAGHYGAIASYLQMVVLLMNTGVAIAGPWLLWRGHREFLLYTLAFSASFVAVFVSIFRLMGWISISMPSDYITIMGTSVHIVLLNIAVADRVRRSERQLLEAEKKTVQMNIEREAVKQQRQFVAMVSHEFRTPLSVIDATAQSMEIACPPGASVTHEFITPRQEKIRRAVRRLLSLLDNVLTNERLDLIKAETRHKAEDLRDMASETAKGWQHLLSTPEQLQIEAGGEPVISLIDHELMALALSNLLDNAVKYSPPGSPIVLRIRQSQGNAWIEVEDCGPGIPVKEIDKIFNKYYRADEAQATPGAGLGLYLVRTIVQQLGGEIDVVSKPGAGACFRMRLPLVA